VSLGEEIILAIEVISFLSLFSKVASENENLNLPPNNKDLI
jgi:hypothetical protein